MKTTRRTNWLVRAAVSLLVLVVAAVSFSVISIRSHQAHAANSTPQASASVGCPPLYLEDIGVWNSAFQVQTVYYRGQEILLDANLYNESGCAIAFIAHPAVYHGSYRLLNIAVPYTSSNFYIQEPQWLVTIPKNAPTGTYKYWFTLSQPSGPAQTRMIIFQVAK